VGEAFISRWAPAPASAAEPELRRRIQERLALDLQYTAVRVARPFFTHLEVWPDIILADLKVAIEYDTTGRSGLEHVGRREDSDRRKDRLLRAAGWEVIRVRCGKLQPIGPYDIVASSVTDTVVTTIIERLADIRGQLIVDAYGAEPSAR
jgi:very-short-patch-repair endonuclease